MRTTTTLVWLAAYLGAAASVSAAAPILQTDSPLQEDAPVVGSAQLVVDRAARSVALQATVQAEAFRASSPPDDRYHALVFEGGGASAKSLFVTSVPDAEVAEILRAIGADDGGGVPMSAWSLRWMPLIPQPSRRVGGTAVRVQVGWEGAEREYELDELLEDPGGEGTHIHFGGNEEHDHRWPSGCLICLFSCPGGVLSNAAYTIRDHERARTTFDPDDLLPPDGTPVTITLTLVSS